MKLINKNHKKIDCVLFYDELDMLNFRLHELDDQVDYFIILESDIDFQGNSKKLFFQENRESFKKWENKIIHLPTININKDYLDSICEITKFREFTPFQNPKLTPNEIIYCQTYELYKFLVSLNLYPEDIILFSHVDEIPNLTQFETITKNLNFEPVILKQKNFIWTTEYYDPTPYFGTCCFQYTSLIDFPNKLFRKYFSKQNRLLDKGVICENGFHFSHFYSLKKTIKKRLLINEEKHLEEKITNCFENLISIRDGGFENPQPLIEYDGDLPRYSNLLPCQTIGREYSKKYTVALNSDLESSDSTIAINFVSDINSTLNNKKTNIVIPQSKYYDVLIEENSLENFQKMFGVNEIKKILKSYSPLSKDIFNFVNGEKSVEYCWSDLKNEFLYDKIKHIL